MSQQQEPVFSCIRYLILETGSLMLLQAVLRIDSSKEFLASVGVGSACENELVKRSLLDCLACCCWAGSGLFAAIVSGIASTPSDSALLLAMKGDRPLSLSHAPLQRLLTAATGLQGEMLRGERKLSSQHLPSHGTRF